MQQVHAQQQQQVQVTAWAAVEKITAQYSVRNRWPSLRLHTIVQPFLGRRPHYTHWLEAVKLRFGWEHCQPMAAAFVNAAKSCVRPSCG